MKAIVQDRYGSVDVLALKEVDPPVPGDGEVLVRVHAAGVDASVWHLMTGLPYVVRLGFGLRKPKQPVRGAELAGRVEALGANVSGLQVGDAVYGIGDGAFAELAVAKASKLALMPANLSFEQASAVPISAATAWQALRDRGAVKAGQRVLVLGAGGGVGSYTVQLARHFGAEVTGVCSTSKVDFVESLGATKVFDYTREDFTGTYDLIVDCAGRRPLKRLRRALNPNGKVVIVGGEGGGRWMGGFLRAAPVGMFIAKERKEDLDAMRPLFESGELIAVVDRTYPLADAAEAIRAWERREVHGKLAITIA